MQGTESRASMRQSSKPLVGKADNPNQQEQVADKLKLHASAILKIKGHNFLRGGGRWERKVANLGSQVGSPISPIQCNTICLPLNQMTPSLLLGPGKVSSNQSPF